MNYFLNCLNNIALDNKYTKWYNAIIERSIVRNELDDSIENHHIFPVSFNKNWKYENDNIVKLTIREHLYVIYFYQKCFWDIIS